MYCQHCGAKAASNTNFCSNCGSPASSAPVVTSVMRAKNPGVMAGMPIGGVYQQSVGSRIPVGILLILIFTAIDCALGLIGGLFLLVLLGKLPLMGLLGVLLIGVSVWGAINCYGLGIRASWGITSTIAYYVVGVVVGLLELIWENGPVELVITIVFSMVYVAIIGYLATSDHRDASHIDHIV